MFFCIDCLPIRSLTRHTHTQDARSDFTQNRDRCSRPSAKRVAPVNAKATHTPPLPCVPPAPHSLHSLPRRVHGGPHGDTRVLNSRGVLNSLTPRRRSSRRCKSCTGSRPRRGEHRTPSASSRRKAAACRRRRRGKWPTVRSAGTRNFFLSRSGRALSPLRLSTMTGMRSGCFARMDAADAVRVARSFLSSGIGCVLFNADGRADPFSALWGWGRRA